MVLPFHNYLWDGSQDGLTEMAAIIVYIEVDFRQDEPITIIFPVSMVVDNYIADSQDRLSTPKFGGLASI